MGCPGVRTRAYASTRMRSYRGDDHARIYVYTRDGYRVGHVDESARGRIYVHSDLDAHGDARVRAISASDAAFNSEANAVVLAMTRAEFAGMAGLR